MKEVISHTRGIGDEDPAFRELVMTNPYWSDGTDDDSLDDSDAEARYADDDLVSTSTVVLSLSRDEPSPNAPCGDSERVNFEASGDTDEVAGRARASSASVPRLLLMTMTTNWTTVPPKKEVHALTTKRPLSHSLRPSVCTVTPRTFTDCISRTEHLKFSRDI